jgi:hypothetical protein
MKATPPEFSFVTRNHALTDIIFKGFPVEDMRELNASSQLA